MYIQCPSCLFADEIPESKIPEKGGNAKCPKCGHKFPIKRHHNPTPSPDRFSEPTVIITPEKQAPVHQAVKISQPAAGKTSRASVNKFSFHGSGGALFGIQIVNILLAIITLGIYHFWGKVRVRKYLYSQTELMGDRFAYHGAGKELFIGWLKAMIFIIIGYAIIFGLSALIHPLFTMLFYPAMLVVIPAAMVGAMRYRLSRTSWHGIRFSFRGAFKAAISQYAGGLFLTAVTLGIYYPFFHAKMRHFWVSNSYFGNTQFQYDGNGRDLLGKFMLAGFLTIITLGIYWFWYKAMVQRYDWQHTAFSSVRFQSTITGGGLFGLTLVNLLLIVFTLGLAFPWVIVRSLRFQFEHLVLEGNVEFDKIKQDAQSAKATGEGLADFLNIDSGLV
ncbi:MAG TPA: DUF898 domain-containing protein [Deltaproteobacteria bacterium]|nr:DUF898 domain-containing protein [Deltaproteobacteria bacterium]